jgi:hypothetical protein
VNQVQRATQLPTILRLELRKSLLSWRALWVYFLSFVPAVIIGVHAVVAAATGDDHTLDTDTEVMAEVFQFYYLRVAVFFGCLGIFTRLFRGEMMEKSAHFYLLTPVRRETVAVGKFLAGAITSSAVFGTGVLASFLLMYSHLAEAGRFLGNGPGLAHLGAYLAVTVLGCLGYGAVFLLVGLLARNPIVPAVILLFWESANHLLPGWLKPASVIFYLEPLLPVELPPSEFSALFGIPADPIATYLAVPGLFVVVAAIVAFACWRARTVEINYSTD